MLSMVRLAALRVSDTGAGQALAELTHRLNASATAFRALSPPPDQSPRSLDDELEALCAALSTSILAARGIRLTFTADPVCIGAQQSWKIGLVVSELITNAARHAFGAREGGSIVVEVSRQAGTIRCAVVDDGAAAARIVPGRGSAILDAIAAELGGTIARTHTSRGSAVVLQVPVEERLGLAPQFLGECHEPH